MMPPNLLFLLTDQQSAHMMGCAGNPWVRTPNLDFLARHGVLFPNAYCANPVCLPSRFSLINGVYPGSIGLRNNDWKLDISKRAPDLLANTPAKRLAAAGYENFYGGVHHFVGGNAGDYGYHYDKGARNEQFYDLLENPGETRNQINEPRYRDELAKLRAVVEQHEKTGNDQQRNFNRERF